MFLKLILDLYEYVRSIMGIRSKEKMEDTNITQIEEEFMLNNNKDEYSEYNEIELVTKNPYSRQANITKQENKKVSKSHNELVKIFYCGYCSRYIHMPIHMYNDKAYCSGNCRNRQYNSDYQKKQLRSISSTF